MNTNHDQLTPEFGLLANGASGRWTVEVDESPDCDQWSLEIEGPQVYLVFQLDDLSLPGQVLRFFRAELQRHEPRPAGFPMRNADPLFLGHLGSASVSIVGDNEDFPRCFLVVGPQTQSTVRVSLHAEDIQSLIEALEQVVEDIPDRAEN